LTLVIFDPFEEAGRRACVAETGIKAAEAVIDPDSRPFEGEGGGIEVELVLLAAHGCSSLRELFAEAANGSGVVLPPGGSGEVDPFPEPGFNPVQLFKVNLDFAGEEQPRGKHAGVVEEFVSRPAFAGDEVSFEKREWASFAGQAREGTCGHGVLDTRFDEFVERHRTATRVAETGPVRPRFR